MSTTKVIALLRAVNVGGCALRMADLKALLARLGYDQPATLLQSGNAVFGAGARRGRAALRSVEAQIERALHAELGVQSDVFVRTPAEWDEAIDANPFDEARTDPSHMVLVTLKDPPTAGAMHTLAAAIKGRERMHAHGRALYVVYPDGMGTSKLTNVIIERALGTRGTARNWNTVLKLRALAAS